MESLWCPDCNRPFESGTTEPWRCPDGHPLEFKTQPRPGTETPRPSLDNSELGVWQFRDWLPTGPTITLGEGMTPLLDVEEWGVSFKLEYLSPTRSFKDRGAAVVLSRATGLGVDCVLEDSSGNAGAAIAAYAARAGIDARIYVPESTAPTKQRRIERTGATVVQVPGPRSEATKACQTAVEAGAGWYASHAWNPAFYAGTATIAYEIAAQRQWDVPDVVVVPVGHGTMLLGAYRGFKALAAQNWTETIPTLVAVQAAGTAPIVNALHGTGSGRGDNQLAGGVQIEDPARFDHVLDAIAETDGDAIAVDEPATEATLDALYQGGFEVEPTAAIAPAALDRLRSTGVIDPTNDVVVPITGAGTGPTQG